MTTRVTDQARYLDLAPQYNSLLAQQLTIQQQISSGKRLTRIDQDPIAASQAQQLHAEDSRVQQDLTNIDAMNSFSQMTGTAVGNAVQYIQRAHELAISGGDATKSPSDLASIAGEVNQVIQGLIDTGAQQFEGQYIFSGAKSNTPAFTAVKDAAGNITSVTYNGDGSSLQAEYAPGKLIDYNALGSNENGGTFGVFKDVGAGIDTFQTLIQLRNDLTSNPQNLSNDVGAVNTVLAHLTAAEVKVGGTQNRLAAMTTAQQDLHDQFGQNLSAVEDTDVAASATKLAGLQNAYQAALAIGAKVGQMSLLDYLR